MVITQWIIQINFFTGCMIISLVPADYANLISGMCCYYYINAARSCSEETLSSCLTAQNWSRHDWFF